MGKNHQKMQKQVLLASLMKPGAI